MSLLFFLVGLLEQDDPTLRTLIFNWKLAHKEDPTKDLILKARLVRTIFWGLVLLSLGVIAFIWITTLSSEFRSLLRICVAYIVLVIIGLIVGVSNIQSRFSNLDNANKFVESIGRIQRITRKRWSSHPDFWEWSVIFEKAGPMIEAHIRRQSSSVRFKERFVDEFQGITHLLLLPSYYGEYKNNLPNCSF